MSDIIPNNLSGLDRVTRIVVGLMIFSLVFVGPETDWGFIGLIPIITGLMGFCPAYALFGIRTARS